MDIEQAYSILGVAPDATAEQVQEAYRELARRYHPDNNRHDEQRATRLFILAARAYKRVLQEERPVERVAAISPEDIARLRMARMLEGGPRPEPREPLRWHELIGAKNEARRRACFVLDVAVIVLVVFFTLLMAALEELRQGPTDASPASDSPVAAPVAAPSSAAGGQEAPAGSDSAFGTDLAGTLMFFIASILVMWACIRVVLWPAMQGRRRARPAGPYKSDWWTPKAVQPPRDTSSMPDEPKN